MNEISPPYAGDRAIQPDADQSDDGQSKATALLLDGLNWAYHQAIDGGLGYEGAARMADDFAARHATIEEAIDRLVAWHVAAAGTSGFVSNLGGVITLPVAMPVNLVATAVVQLHLVLTIAHLRGFDIKSEPVRIFAIACLSGGAVLDLLKDAGVKIGSRLAARAIMAIPGATLLAINKAVGFRLVTKAGATGAANLSKLVPIIGGLVGGAVDGATTYAIGRAARSVFPVPHDSVSEDTASGSEA